MCSQSSSFYVCIVLASVAPTLNPSQDQSPPKRDLKVSDPNVRNLSLAELHLAPSSVLLLRFEDERLNGRLHPSAERAITFYVHCRIERSRTIGLFRPFSSH